VLYDSTGTAIASESGTLEAVKSLGGGMSEIKVSVPYIQTPGEYTIMLQPQSDDESLILPYATQKKSDGSYRNVTISVVDPDAVAVKAFSPPGVSALGATVAVYLSNFHTVLNPHTVEVGFDWMVLNKTKKEYEFGSIAKGPGVLTELIIRTPPAFGLSQASVWITNITSFSLPIIPIGPMTMSANPPQVFISLTLTVTVTLILTITLTVTVTVTVTLTVILSVTLILP